MSAKKTRPHNVQRKKQYAIEEGVVLPPLVDAGIFTVAGKVVAAQYDKFRQINRFVEMLGDIIPQDTTHLSVVDFGCGKSYLTFIVYYYLTEIRNIEVEMVGLDLKKDVIERCNESAEKYGYKHLSFQCCDIKDYEPASPVNLVISLHACDTATDFALFNALQWGASYVMCVPCCQHELNGQIQSDQLSLLTRYGIVQERTSALMTDAIRANIMMASGYKTRLLEFIDFDHTPKNILIRAKKSNIIKRDKMRALDEATRLIKTFKLSPTIMKLWQNSTFCKELHER